MVQSLGGMLSGRARIATRRAWSRSAPAGIGYAALALLALAGSALPGHAQESTESKPASPLKLELNRLEPSGESCRTYLLIDNKAGPSVKSLKVDLYAFDTEGVAQKRLAVELGPIQEKKTMVRLFDFTGLACPKIGRVLLNDVIACDGGDAARDTCLERIETTSKASAEFIR